MDKEPRWELYIETHAARDEYVGEAVGFFWMEKCILGFHKAYKLPIYAVVVWNICIGIWKDTNAI